VAEYFLKGVGFAVKRVTDVHSEEDLKLHNPRELGSGFYEFGVVIDGAFVSILELKAGHVEAQIAAWKKAHPPADKPAVDPDSPQG
jgi:hypothetical protein